MRLFTAITFQEEIKTYLYQIIEEMRCCTSGGSFTARDNLHLTLNFIGETNRQELVEQAMHQAVRKSGVHSFMLTMGGLGKFERREGDIYWVGVDKNEMLWKLREELVIQLKKADFVIDDLRYRPHLTLGRRVIPGKNFDVNKLNELCIPREMRVSKISLMKSERILGKLVYTEINKVNIDK